MTLCRLALLASILAVADALFAATPPAAQLRWIDDAAPAAPAGVAFGVPWPRGTLERDTTLRLADASGSPVPAQTWPLAFWPDGSVKWTGVAVAGAPGLGDRLTLSVGAPAAPASPLAVTEEANAFVIDAGAFVCRVPRSGSALVSSITVEGREIARSGRLVAVLETRSAEAGRRVTREEDFTGSVERVTLEQSGPVRAVVKVEGRHRANSGDRLWLPFVVRLYFTAGVDSIRLVHSIVYDGEAERDFIRGLGLAFDVPLREEIQNRHVRLGGDSGLFSEPVRAIPGFRAALVAGAAEMSAEQLAGRRAPAFSALDEKTRGQLASMASWDDYKLAQLSPDSFAIEKRTGAHGVWVNAHRGRRSLGAAYVGDVSGGLAVSIRRFWQKHPSALEIEGATTDTATLRAWLWSPDAPAMDLRHYDDQGHALSISYEDYEPGFSTPHGVANTSELTFWPLAATPSAEALLARARVAATPPVLACEPARYDAARVFGAWAPPDLSDPLAVRLEQHLDKAFAFFRDEIDRRGWYGFWHYGDVMRTYDSARRQWQYDVGGHAWNNAELNPDTWLWYQFLRTGRADHYRLAEDFTRHSSEVDVYHLGRFAGLGSRHNVVHWGCGAKEPRISEAALKRFHYYLSTDERTGDLMRAVLDADAKTVEINPLRKVMPPPSVAPGLVRSGPDWLAFASNWMTEWERTGDTRYRDYIVAGFDAFASDRQAFLKNLVYAYDPATKKLSVIGEPNIPMGHFIVIFGGDQIVEELLDLVPHPAFASLWLDLQKRWTASPRSAGYAPARAAAHVARASRDPADVARARSLLERTLAPDSRASRLANPPVYSGPDVPSPVMDARGANMPETAQWAHEIIQASALMRDLPRP